MRSTFGQLKDFKESIIWLDVIEELEVWLEQIRDELENPGAVLSHRILDRLGGCAEAVRNFTNIIDVLIELNEDEVDVTRQSILKKLIKGRDD